MILTALLVAGTACVANAQKGISMNLWNNNAPNDNGDAQDTAKVWVYKPAKADNTGRCVVICPGGGYSHLAMEHEGHNWAPFFNNMGITAVVLKYRMPHGNCEVPIADAEEALKLVRRNAAAWGVKADQVGIMGFSAGGHLASTIATHSKGEARPDFQILFYPVITMMPDITHQGSHDNFLGKDAKKKDEKLYSNDAQVSRTTPRAIILLADDDRIYYANDRKDAAKIGFDDEFIYEEIDRKIEDRHKPMILKTTLKMILMMTLRTRKTIL